MSFDYDVTIVGAGPIGSTLAYQLALEGLKVSLIDKKKVVGLPLQCAGIVNKRILDFNEIPNDLILNEAKGAYLHSQNNSLTVFKKETQAYIIDRVGLDQFLFNRAGEYADTFLSSKVTGIDKKSGTVEFKSDSTLKKIKSRIIVGADGPLSLCSSKLDNKFEYYNASQYLVKVDKIREMSFVDLYAKADLFPGFVWVIPTYENIFRIGLFSRDDYKKQSEILNDFLNKDFEYEDFEVLEKYKGKIPIYNKDNKLFEDRVLLIGDSAAQVKPTTGGGLLVGLESVQFAKEAILDALDKINDGDDLEILSQSLANYQKSFEDRFLQEFEYQFKVQKTLCTLSDDDLDYFFIKLKEKGADKLISQYGDMDNQSKLVKEFIKRGLILSLLPKIHKSELARIWLLK